MKKALSITFLIFQDMKYLCFLIDSLDSVPKELFFVTEKMERKPNKIHSCEHCGKRFSKAFALKEHIWSHTGEKPYKCAICDKRFARSWEFYQHKKFHLQENINIEVENDVSERLEDFRSVNESDQSYLIEVMFDLYPQDCPMILRYFFHD